MSQKKDNILFFSESGFKVAKIIFTNPSEAFHLRKLCRMANLSTTAVTRAVGFLRQVKIITTTKTELTTNIKAALDSDAYRFYKQVFNLYRLQGCCLMDTLKASFQPEAIVLFGSYAKGEDVEESDIDLLIITSHKSQDFSQNDFAAYEKELHRHIHLQVLPTLKNTDSSFKNAIANGIVLYGRVKVV